jgi:hypothetical protein
MNWYAIKDGAPEAFAMYHRHYSCVKYRRKNRQRLFVGPGEKIVLMTNDSSALFVWRKFIDKSGQQGVNCAIFRNEHPERYLSSDLILEAEQIAWQRWPGERLYTYVNARKIRSVNPGCCFKVAGWTVCGRTVSRKLIILEKLPEQKQ